MKFKVGDTVRVVRCRLHINCENNNTIRKIVNIEKKGEYPYVLEDCDEIFREDELELVQEKQFTKADLKDGDIVIYRNGNKRTVISNNLIAEDGYIGKHLSEYNDELKGKGYNGSDIVKVERPVKYETVFERKEEVLDEAEKRYLSDVIRPFKNRIKYIYKKQSCVKKNRQFIGIVLEKDTLDLPYFTEGTMYKGMQIDKNYTLEELNLK